MKNTKNRVLSFASIVVLMSMQSSNGAQQSAQKSAASKRTPQNPGFQLYNKSHETTPTPISYTISTSTGNILENDTIQSSVQPGKAENRVIPASLLSAKLTITANGKTSSFDIKPNGKTIYLSWKPGHKPELYPQTGKMGGLSSETESGVSIGLMGATNVKQSEITQTK